MVVEYYWFVAVAAVMKLIADIKLLPLATVKQLDIRVYVVPYPTLKKDFSESV